MTNSYKVVQPSKPSCVESGRRKSTIDSVKNFSVIMATRSRFNFGMNGRTRRVNGGGVSIGYRFLIHLIVFSVCLYLCHSAVSLVLSMNMLITLTCAAYGLEHWTFNKSGLMQERRMSGNDVKITAEERWFKGMELNKGPDPEPQQQ